MEHFRVLFRRKTRKSTLPKTCVFSHECMYQQPSCIPPLLEASFSFSDDLRVVAYAKGGNRVIIDRTFRNFYILMVSSTTEFKLSFPRMALPLNFLRA